MSRSTAVDLAPKHLRLPYALTSLERLVSADDANRDEQHYCPNCGKAVTLRRGDVRKAHFAHRSGTDCKPESVIHKIAKRLIGEVININAMSNDQVITIERECENCGLPAAQDLAPGTFTSSSEEEWVGTYKVDVAGFRGTEVALGIEIFHKHAVPEEKAGNLAVHWIELDAQAVIDNPFHWKPTKGRLKKVALCQPCRKKVRRVKRNMDRWNVPPHLYTVILNPERAAFVARTDSCWKCNTEVPVFWWKGVPFDEGEPPSPRPSTIQFRYSKQYGGKYWVNTCAKCKSTLGDNYVYLLNNPPLGSPRLPLRNVSRDQGSVRIETGQGSVNSFLRTILRR